MISSHTRSLDFSPWRAMKSLNDLLISSPHVLFQKLSLSTLTETSTPSTSTITGLAFLSKCVSRTLGPPSTFIPQPVCPLCQMEPSILVARMDSNLPCWHAPRESTICPTLGQYTDELSYWTQWTAFK